MLPLALITALVLWGTAAAVQTWAQLRHQRVARQESAQQRADAHHNERMATLHARAQEEAQTQARNKNQAQSGDEGTDAPDQEAPSETKTEPQARNQPQEAPR